YDIGSIDARLNYWGYPGVESVAAGKIRDFSDYPYLIKAMDAFVPYLRTDDVRQKEIARRIDQFSQQYLTDAERFDAFASRSDTIVWISSVSIPSTQCGWLSSRTGKIGSQNCNNLMPFVCEK
ncbi:hypothetical protein TELCIR_21380, partial [Teladorsagia circumcincta]